MSDRQISSLARQLALCHAAAKRARGADGRPALTYCLASYGGRLEERMEHLQGSATWPAARHRHSWLDCLGVGGDGGGDCGGGGSSLGASLGGAASARRRLVYLSAEGEETLETIDPAAVYVIGGLVDRNQHRGLSLRRAQDAGVSTARLPLEEYVQMSVEGKGRALTVNQCYELLLLRAQGHSWEEVVRQVMPLRRARSEHVGGL